MKLPKYSVFYVLHCFFSLCFFQWLTVALKGDTRFGVNTRDLTASDQNWRGFLQPSVCLSLSGNRNRKLLAKMDVIWPYYFWNVYLSLLLQLYPSSSAMYKKTPTFWSGFHWLKICSHCHAFLCKEREFVICQKHIVFVFQIAFSFVSQMALYTYELGGSFQSANEWFQGPCPPNVSVWMVPCSFCL